ncbi:MAG TPA: class I SAM-dependent methyltransferase [Cyclobacteriaceae bacterium]|jgi:hypothetical protein|nr:class I SAM-dependent methyltransferase [Cyclobacteriaceae bacterium]
MGLRNFIESNNHRQIIKWNHYFEIYERYFEAYRGKEIVVLEIGVFQGGSLQMWKSYFGPKARIYGIDINPECKKFEEEKIEIFIGSQSDKTFLQSVKAKIPPIDILIDDGGHSMKQQIVSFKELFDHINPGGIYLCEDLHTSYWLAYGGGHKRKGSFIEFSKNLIDQLNAHSSEQRSLTPTSFTNSTYALHYYESILIIEKRNRVKPKEVTSGEPSLTTNTKINKSIKYFALLYLNSVLRFFRLSSFRW